MKYKASQVLYKEILSKKVRERREMAQQLYSVLAAFTENLSSVPSNLTLVVYSFLYSLLLLATLILTSMPLLCLLGCPFS